MERKKYNSTKEENPQEAMMSHITSELLRTDGFFMMNKKLLKLMGLHKAVLIAIYVDRHNFHKDSYQNFDGWFYCTHSKVMEITGISERLIRRNKQQLIEENILQSKFDGNPAKEYLKINSSELFYNLFPALTKKEGLALTKKEGLALTKKEGLIYKEPTIRTYNKNLENFLQYFPESFQISKSFQINLDEFILHREKIKKPLTDLAKKRIANELVKKSQTPEQSSEAIKEAIKKKWIKPFPKPILGISTPKRYNTPLEALEFVMSHEKPLKYIKHFKRMVVDKLIMILDDEDIVIANAVGELYITVTDNVRDLEKYRTWEPPTPGEILREYSDWIEENKWITNKDSSILSFTSGVFSRFVLEYSKGLERHPFTGKIV